jgi:hypothetical protein
MFVPKNYYDDNTEGPQHFMSGEVATMCVRYNHAGPFSLAHKDFNLFVERAGFPASVFHWRMKCRVEPGDIVDVSKLQYAAQLGKMNQFGDVLELRSDDTDKGYHRDYYAQQIDECYHHFRNVSV